MTLKCKNLKSGFTLVELLVVVGMIAVILGAITTSVSAAQKRARIQKATSDVKVITQAILAYENWKRDGLPNLTKAQADSSTLGFLLGNGGTGDYGSEKIPTMLMAALQGGGVMKDPWGTPYTVTIRKKGMNSSFTTARGSMKTGYFLPNFYRLSDEERGL